MDQVSEVSHRADMKRLGEEDLLNDYGEFRHYLVEKAAFNVDNRAAGKEVVDWPTCISSTTLSESRRQELSREKLISKLLLSIQAFTYSCCSEAAEVRRLAGKDLASGGVGRRQDQEKALFSKFGIRSISCGKTLLVMQEPSASVDDGSQPFEGRFGKLRYLALAVMVATSAVSREIVQLALDFPLGSNVLTGRDTEEDEDNGSGPTEEAPRAPIAHPILCSHVLSHVVAAMCAVCGRARARSDSVDIVPLSSENVSDFDYGQIDDMTNSVFSDCESFIGLGFLARVLQVLLGSILHRLAGMDSEVAVEQKILGMVDGLLDEHNDKIDMEDTWRRGCCQLLKIAIPVQTTVSSADALTETDADGAAESILSDACTNAEKAGAEFLADAGAVLQVLAPGWSNCVVIQEGSSSDSELSRKDRLAQLMVQLRVEPISTMVESPVIGEIVAGWYQSARSRPKPTSEGQQGAIKADASLERNLDCKRLFRVADWPMVGPPAPANAAEKTPKISPVSPLVVPEEISNVSALSPEETLRDAAQSPSRKGVSVPSPIPMYSSKKRVTLLGGYHANDVDSTTDGHRRRITMLPTSYTDLYAELGALCPDSEQTALCLVCGQVLNAGGKGECTKHAYKCGGGSGIFFLLQECVSLIMHGVKAAYIHSPYVDSHGETPQYRGRPLNLDLDRYNILREMWSGHLVRERVISERASSRQVIIANFY